MDATLQADRFAVLTAPARCHHCHAPIQVSALLVAAYRELEDEDWSPSDDSALLIYVSWIDDQSRRIWNERAPWMQPMASATAGFTYLANVCACGALQGDYYLTQPSAPFFPIDEAGMSSIGVEWIDVPIGAIADVSLSSWTDLIIERHPYAGWLPRASRKRRGSRSKA